MQKSSTGQYRPKTILVKREYNNQIWFEIITTEEIREIPEKSQVSIESLSSSSYKPSSKIGGNL